MGTMGYKKGIWCTGESFPWLPTVIIEPLPLSLFCLVVLLCKFSLMSLWSGISMGNPWVGSNQPIPVPALTHTRNPWVTCCGSFLFFQVCISHTCRHHTVGTICKTILLLYSGLGKHCNVWQFWISCSVEISLSITERK